jgi:hypothetical protein
VAHVASFTVLWVGLATYVAAVPRPPPIWPTIMMEVGTVLVPAPVLNERLLVRLMVRPWVLGTVITTGDHEAEELAAGFRGAQVAVEPLTAAPQL